MALNDNLSKKPQTVTKLKLPDGTVIDADDLDQKEKEAYIEFAIHLAAPRLAKMLAGELFSVNEKPVPQQKNDDSSLIYPLL